MNYPLHARKRRGRHAALWLKLFAAIFLCIVTGLFLRGGITIFFASLAHGAESAIESIIPPGFHDAISLGKENQMLREQIILLTAQNSDRNLLLAENLELKESFGRKDKEKVLYATVLQKPPQSPYDTFILDVGTDLGVKVNDTVVVGSLAIGTIVEAGASYSKAELFSSPGKTFTGSLGPKHVSIEAHGMGGGSFAALIPIGTTVLEGDSLVLPSISSKIFGLVEKVDELKEEGFKKILFELPINPDEISTVGILVSK